MSSRTNRENHEHNSDIYVRRFVIKHLAVKCSSLRMHFRSQKPKSRRSIGIRFQISSEVRCSVCFSGYSDYISFFPFIRLNNRSLIICAINPCMISIVVLQLSLVAFISLLSSVLLSRGSDPPSMKPDLPTAASDCSSLSERSKI